MSSNLIKLYIYIYIYIYMDSRLKGLSIESKNTQNGAWTRKLWPSPTQNGAWTRKLWPSEVGDFAQTVQLGSCLKPMKLRS